MTINKAKALDLYKKYHDSMPVTSLKQLESLIELNALLGHEFVELFVEEKVCESIVDALRKKGFVVQYLKWKANNNWRLVGIQWNVSEFIK
jgi:hypothetical protein